VFNLLNSATEVDRSTALIRTSSSVPSIVAEYNNFANTLKFGTAANTLSQSFNLMVAGLPNYLQNPTFQQILTTYKNPYYNLPVSWQAPRQFRFNVGVQW
jgi:hypothetical protein